MDMEEVRKLMGVLDITKEEAERVLMEFQKSGRGFEDILDAMERFGTFER